MKVARCLILVTLLGTACMQTNRSENVLRTDNVFKPQGPRQVSTELELVIDRATQIATLQHPTRCDGVIRSTSKIETVESSRPSVLSYIVSGAGITSGVVAVGEDGPTLPSLAPLAFGGGLLALVLLSSSTERTTRFEQQWLPQKAYPCGGFGAPDVEVRVGLGAAAVNRTSDANGLVYLPRHLTASLEAPAAFVAGRSIPVRFLEAKPEPLLPMAPSGASAPNLEAH